MFPEKPKKQAEKPKRAGRIFTLLAYVVILGMVVIYFNSTVTYWQGVSNQKQKEIEQLIKELGTAKLELQEVHANLSLKKKDGFGLEGVQKEGELKINGELLSLYELFALPPGMDEYYDEVRDEFIPLFRGSYSNINMFRALMVLHDSGQMPLDGRWYKELYGVEPRMVAKSKLKDIIKRLRGYESLEGREKIPRLRESVRGDNLKVLSSFVQNQIVNFPGEDYPRFPLETLSLRGGDGEDKVMLLAALLEVEGYETGLLTIFDPENNFYHTALAVKDEANWVGNKLMLKGYEKEGFSWILLDPYLKTDFGKLPDWSRMYRLPSGAIEIPSTRYVFTVADPEAMKSAVEKIKGPLSRDKTGIITLERGRRTTVNVLAVVGDRGIILPVQTEIREGEGRLLLSIDDTLYFTSTQTSITLALKIAKKVTGATLSDKDIIIRVANPYNETLALSGESAGSSIAVALIANLMDKKIKSDVLLTGTIQEDGRIGVVGSIPTKAEAARSAGIKTLLVPQGQGVSLAGLKVVEVSRIEEALGYMTE
jgi:uncharacterized protein